MIKRKKMHSLRRSVVLMILAMLALVLLLLYIIFRNIIIPQTRESMEEKVTTIARTIALVPLISEGLEERKSDQIQQYTSKITRRNDIMFIVVTDMNGIRYSHPDPSLVGKPFAGGDMETVLAGGESLSEGEGPLGESFRAFVPVYNNRGIQVGAVIVGLWRDEVYRLIHTNEWLIVISLISGAVLGGLGALILARRIKKMMFGMEPSHISKLLEERSAMLQSLREGVIAVDTGGKITLINMEAERLLRRTGYSEGMLRHPVSEYWPALHLEDSLTNGTMKLDEEIELSGVTVLANVRPVVANGEIAGAIATFRDKTEMTQLAERLSGVSLYAEALRAQSHEFMNKLHVIMGMTHMELYDDLKQYVAGTFNRYQDEVGMITRNIKDPVMAGFLLGKMSRAREQGSHLVLTADSYLPECRDPDVMHELITITGNLLDNAIEALQGQGDGEMGLSFSYRHGELAIRVEDNGPGIADEVMKILYEQGASTKGENRGTGLYLTKRSVEKLGGSLTFQSDNVTGTEFEAIVPYPAKDEGHE